jgi:hypothetical protein
MLLKNILPALLLNKQTGLPNLISREHNQKNKFEPTEEALSLYFRVGFGE